jgi:glycine/D-amino acid oxidase-like deaminating enzyme
VAVIGCGIIGLTSAIAAQRAGMQVTIYTRDLLPRTRSVRANGRWTPDSRIALTSPAGPQFAATWERMARFSWKTFLTYVGLPGHPIEFADYYNLSDGGAGPHHPDGKGDYASTGLPQSSSEFASYGSRIADLNAPPRDLSDAENPFPVRSAKQSTTMMFNFAPLGEVLMSQFRQAGGRIVIREFHAPSELGTLPEPVIINCPGYAARDLWKDKTLIPVRGQTGWLVPQPEVKYGLNYRNIALLSKRDGVMIQNIDPQGLGELYGVGDSNELIDRSDTESAIGVMAEMFGRMQARG